MVLVKKDQESNPKIEDYVKSIIPEAIKLSDVSAEISFQLSLDSVSKFKDLFDGLDNKLDELNINSYGISITTLEEVFLRVAENDDVHRHEFEKKPTLENYEKIDNFDINSIKINPGFKLFCMHFKALIKKRINYFKRDKKGWVAEVILPIFIIFLGLILTQTSTTFVDSGNLELQPSMYSTPLDVIYSGNSSAYLINNVIPQNDYKFEEFKTNNLKLWEEDNFQKRSVNRKGTYFFNKSDQSTGTYVYHTMINTISPDSAPLFISKMNLAAIRNATNNSNLKISHFNSPFPLTELNKQFENTSDAFVFSFIFAIGLAFIPASMIVFIIKEKSGNIKHQQLVSGVSIVAYWTSNFLVDIITYLIPAIFSICMIKAFNVESLANGENFGATWLLFIFYGFSIVNFTYVFSFLFKDYGNAQLIIFFFSFTFGKI